MKCLIIGCGYLGSRVAALWRARGDDVCVVTRSAEHAKDFENQGYQPIVADITKPETLADLPQVDSVLCAVGFDRSTGQSIEEIYVEGLRNVVNALPEPQERFLYISSTGVYHQRSGEWVDEDSPTEPERDGGKACLAAEQLLSECKFSDRVIVLRLAGIYGPERVPFQQAIRDGEPVPVEPEGFLNLIHVDDAARVVLAAEEAKAPRTYCVSDHEPAVRGEYYAYLAEKLGGPPPQFGSADEGSSRKARSSTNKRISSRRLDEEFQIALKYPTYRAGLDAILGSQ